MAAASEGPGGASATTEGEAEEATAETSEFIREMLENAYGVTSEGVIVQGCIGYTIGESVEVDFEYSAAAVDLMETYIQTGEMGFIREYWQDETTGYTVYVYYSYCDNPPTISEYTPDIETESSMETSYGTSTAGAQYYDFSWLSSEQEKLTDKFRGGSQRASVLINTKVTSLINGYISTTAQSDTSHKIIATKQTTIASSPVSNLINITDIISPSNLSNMNQSEETSVNNSAAGGTPTGY